MSIDSGFSIVVGIGGRINPVFRGHGNADGSTHGQWRIHSRILANGGAQSFSAGATKRRYGWDNLCFVTLISATCPAGGRRPPWVQSCKTGSWAVLVSALNRVLPTFGNPGTL
jgi:hypothetical protein